MATLTRTQAALNDCAAHLRETRTSGSQIENFLTQYLLVVLCAEMQEQIVEIACARGKKVGDSAIAEFVDNSSRRVLRSVRKDELAGFVTMFSKKSKEIFNSTLDDRTIAVYNNAVLNRHNVAHKSGVTVSFGDVVEAVRAAERILDTFEDALAKA